MNTPIPVIVDGQAGIFAHSKARVATLNAKAKERLCLMDARIRTLMAEPEEGAATAEYAVVLGGAGRHPEVGCHQDVADQHHQTGSESRVTAMKTMTCRWRLARLPPDLCTGSATAEFAIVLPSIIAIAGLILAIGRVVIVSMDCQSAAAAAAREFVVTGDESSARSIAADVAGGKPHVSIAHDGQSTSVTVECSVLPGPLDVTPTRVTGNATAISQ